MENVLLLSYAAEEGSTIFVLMPADGLEVAHLRVWFDVSIARDAKFTSSKSLATNLGYQYTEQGGSQVTTIASV